LQIVEEHGANLLESICWQEGSETGGKDMAERYRYGKIAATVTNAGGVHGFLLRNAVENSFFFRVYHDDGEFTDYEIHHDDLEVTITLDALASFYQFDDHWVLDHSPEVLGLEKISNEEEKIS
jgi:hypothetical protein